MALSDQYALAQDTGYRHRVEVAIWTAIEAVAQEATSGDLNKDKSRKTLVRKFINNADDRALIITNFIDLSTTNPSIAAAAANPASVPDGDIQYVINSLVDTLAGINVNNP